MIVRDNIFLTGVSGKVKNMVVKQYKDKTVITSVPNMSNRVLSEKQKQSNKKMKHAIGYAKKITADRVLKERACQMMKVPPNQVFRALVKDFLLTSGNMSLIQALEQDKQTLATIKSTILSKIPDARIVLHGNRAAGNNSTESDWDLLILVDREYPKTTKWELQDALFTITLQSGSRANIMLVQKVEWYDSKDYELLRKNIGENLLDV